MKQLLTISLSLLFLLNTIGWHGFFFWRQWEIRQDMQEKTRLPINQKNLTKISLPISHILHPKQTEIRIAGQLYDILKLSIHANTATLYCIRDLEEENVINAWISLLSDNPLRQQTGEDGLIAQMIKWLTLTYENPASAGFTALHLPPNSLPPYHISLHTFISGGNTPPPKA